MDARGLVSMATAIPWSRSNTQNATSTAPIVTVPPDHDSMEALVERYTEIMKTTLQVQKTIQPLDDADQLRIVVMDHASGNVGLLQIPIKR